MSSDHASLPEPLTPSGCDLRDFPHTPMFRSRLFGSSFHARATDSEWRAGVTLWLKSWDQVPAGSLPDDDIDLCRLAELGRDMRAWRKLKDGAMRGWIKCSDGRLYHPVVADGVNNAIDAKHKQRMKTAKARIAALEKHLAEARSQSDKIRITDEIERIKQTLPQSLLQGLSQSQSHRPREEKGREGEGKEKGLDIDTSPDASPDGDAPPLDPPPDSFALPAKTPKTRKLHGNEEDHRAAHWMHDLILETDPTAKEPKWDAWANEIRLMREQDDRTHREICQLFGWTQRDAFWKANVLSPSKLREKWTQLVANRDRAKAVVAAPTNRQEALEASNNEVASRWAAQGATHEEL